jgi:hypothetical protein
MHGPINNWDFSKLFLYTKIILRLLSGFFFHTIKDINNMVFLKKIKVKEKILSGIKDYVKKGLSLSIAPKWKKKGLRKALPEG